MAERKTLGPKRVEKQTKGKPAETSRANETRRDTDKTPDLGVGFNQIDQAIQYYFDDVLNLTVIENSEPIKVPVIYASSERWKNIQLDGYLRDKAGKLQAPIVAYNRVGGIRNRLLSNKIDANYPQVYITQDVQYTHKNKYTDLVGVYNSKPVRERRITVVPDYIDVQYELIIWTNYTEQMNTIVESILYSEGAYWGDKDRWMFRTKIDDYNSTTDLLQDTDRLSRTNITITVFGYIIPDAHIKYISNKLGNKGYTIRTIKTDIA